MSTESKSLNRRTLLRGAAATAALVPLAGALAACAGGGADNASSTSSESKTSEPTSSDTGTESSAPTESGTESSAPTETAPAGDNPFSVESGSTVEAVIFNGGYGYDYVTFAADQATKKNDGVTFDVKPSTQIGTELQPKFAGGTPPDLIDNSGADLIGINAILDQLEDLEQVFKAPNYEGTVISDTLFGGVRQPGTFGDKLAAINYVMTLYAVWYSGSLFDENSWTPPKTWDEALDLGAKAKEKKLYLWVWGKEAATYYEWFAMDTAIKSAGHEVLVGLENLEPNAWSHPAIQDTFKAMETAVKNGYFVPGGADTQFTAAQAKWSNDKQALLYPSGSWIENEMASATADGFQMKGVPELVLTDSPAMPYETLRAGAGEPFIVPSTAANAAGGMELLRAMLSKDAASNFAKTRKAPTIVSGTVPPDGFGSTALVSQSEMLSAAKDNVFSIKFFDFYGLNGDSLDPWNQFLSGSIDAAGLTTAMQSITDKVANDSDIEKLPKIS